MPNTQTWIGTGNHRQTIRPAAWARAWRQNPPGLLGSDGLESDQQRRAPETCPFYLLRGVSASKEMDGIGGVAWGRSGKFLPNFKIVPRPLLRNDIHGEQPRGVVVGEVDSQGEWSVGGDQRRSAGAPRGGLTHSFTCDPCRVGAGVAGDGPVGAVDQFDAKRR